MLILIYGAIATSAYIKWHAIFLKDQVAYTNDRTFSTFVLIVASLFWVVTVPIAWIERRKRLNSANVLNVEEKG